MKANHWPGGGATITFAPALNGAPLLLSIHSGATDEAQGDLNISQTTHLLGNGAGLTIVDALAASDRAFWIEPGAVVDISGLTVQHGSVNQTGGGGLYVASGAALTLDHSAILSNTDASSNGGGGGLHVEGVLTLTHSLVQGNHTSATAGGGALATFGGAQVTVRASTLDGNQAGYGGGGLVAAGVLLNVTQSTVSNNWADVGGGLSAEVGQINLIDSTLSGNHANNIGGGVVVPASITYVRVAAYNVTVTNNQADADLNGTGSGGGLVQFSSLSLLSLQNSLIAGNRSTLKLGLGYVPAKADDCAGALISQGYNLIQVKPANCSVSAAPGDQIGVATPALGLLEDNGGSTLTHALLPGSPAIDAANPGGCNDASGAALLTDQRGYPRVANGAGATRCDIGAYEVQRLLDLPLVRR
jgi:hypothetical protein